MASNKKPRKRYTPKRVRVNAFRPEDVKDMWEMLSKIETRTLLKLQYGNCTKDEMCEVRDLFNVVVFAAMHRAKTIVDDDESILAVKGIVAAGGDVREVMMRADKVGHCVCKTDELRRILNALETSTEFVRDALAVGATTFMHEFNASLLVRDAVGVAKKFSVDKRVVDFAFREAQNLDNFKFSKRYEHEYSKCCARIAEQISYCSQRLQNKGVPA